MLPDLPDADVPCWREGELGRRDIHVELQGNEPPRHEQLPLSITHVGSELQQRLRVEPRRDLVGVQIDGKADGG